MNILLLGGFLGSGKTTVLSRLIETMIPQGNRLCVIENEIGQYAIDDLILKQSGVEVTTIMGGCVCCQVTGSLLEGLKRIKEEIDPDWVLVELTGLALLDTLRETIETYLADIGPVVTVAVMDGARWLKLRNAAYPIVSRQVSGGDILVINKIDRCPDVEAVVRDVSALVENHPCLCMQAISDAAGDLLKLINQQISSV